MIVLKPMIEHTVMTVQLRMILIHVSHIEAKVYLRTCTDQVSSNHGIQSSNYMFEAMIVSKTMIYYKAMIVF